MINRFTLLLSLVGMTLTLHLWIQKERGFDQGCWGMGVGEPPKKPTDCQDARLQEASQLLGVPTAGLGYIFYLSMSVLAFAKSVVPQRLAAKCHGLSELTVGLAFPIALYLVYVQVSASAYCPLCLTSSALVAILFAMHAHQWRRGGFTSASSREQELGYACTIAFGGGGAIIAMLLFVERIGVRRMDQGAEALQIEAVLSQALPKHLAAYASQKKQPSQASSRIKADEWIDSETPYLGSPAGISVILFLDPNCSHCKNSFTSFIGLSEKYKDSAKFYLLPRPLWDYSIPQVKALELAKGSGKYFEFWRLQFENQQKNGIGVAGLTRLFEKLGLDSTDFEKRLEATAAAVASRKEKAQAAGINSTPTYFVDGARVSVVASDENIARLIRLAAKSQTNPTKETPVPSAASK